MFASIRRYHSNSPDELLKRVNQGFVPIISRAPGFVAYYCVKSTGGTVASISIFKNETGAEASNKMAADWVRQNIASLVAGPPEITAGEIAVSKEAGAKKSTARGSERRPSA